MLLEMAKRRALEVLERDNFLPERHLYQNPVDAQWLGVGVGFALARGWCEPVACGEFKLTESGKSVLAQMRIANSHRLPDELVPTKLRREDADYFAFALRRVA